MVNFKKPLVISIIAIVLLEAGVSLFLLKGSIFPINLFENFKEKQDESLVETQTKDVAGVNIENISPTPSPTITPTPKKPVKTGQTKTTTKVQPTQPPATPTPTLSPTDTPTPPIAPSNTPIPTLTDTPTPTATLTPSPTLEPTVTP